MPLQFRFLLMQMFSNEFLRFCSPFSAKNVYVWRVSSDSDILRSVFYIQGNQFYLHSFHMLKFFQSAGDSIFRVRSHADREIAMFKVGRLTKNIPIKEGFEI